MLSEGSMAAKPAARLFVPIALAIAMAVAGGLAFGTSTAEAKFKQPGCAKFKKKIKNAKGKAAKAKLKRKYRQCRANRTVYNQVKNSRFVGAREDGEPVDLVFCANGRMADDLDSPFGEVYRKGWRITNARIRGKNFTAVYEALISRSGGQVSARVGSLVKRNGKWQSGAESSGRPFLAGDVKKTSARKECRRL